LTTHAVDPNRTTPAGSWDGGIAQAPITETPEYQFHNSCRGKGSYTLANENGNVITKQWNVAHLKHLYE
jgi:hypothetical protein